MPRKYEIKPSRNLQPYMIMLALRDVAASRWSNEPSDSNAPYGAGLCIRRDVAEEYCKKAVSTKKGSELDRTGDALLSGGDIEFSLIACGMGLGRGVFRELELQHIIPSGRVEKAYLVRLLEGHVCSNVILESHYRSVLNHKPWPSFFRSLRVEVRRFVQNPWFYIQLRIAWRNGIRQGRKMLEGRQSEPEKVK